MNWVQINIRVNEDFRYMKIHTTGPNNCSFTACGLNCSDEIVAVSRT